MVPTGRLELPRLSPLPPQGSVYTNFTTSAYNYTFRVTSFGSRVKRETRIPKPYLGTSGVLGAAGTSLGGAGISTFAGCSTTTLLVTLAGTVCCAYSHASPRLERKNTVPRIAVVRVRKFAEPRLPNNVCEAPLPKAAPISAPLPCCSRIRPISPTAEMTSITSTKSFINYYSSLLNQRHGKSSKTLPPATKPRRSDHRQYPVGPEVPWRCCPSCCRHKEYAARPPQICPCR